MMERLKTLSPSLVLVLLLGLLLLPSTPAEAKRKKGEKVQFTGLATDSAGRPLEQVQVILESARRKFVARKFRRQTVDTFRVSTDTDSGGSYTITWPWNNYYNQFELLVAVPYRKGSQETLQILARYDVTEEALDGKTVVTSLVVDDTTFLNKLRRFLGELDAEDEKNLYQRMGKPDKVEKVGARGEVESSWWYFDAGKVFRFEAGELVKEESFDPVKEFPKEP